MKRTELLLTVFAAAAFIGLLYGALIFNHSQDVSRDKFLIEHCQKVQSAHDNLLTGSQTFTCEANK